MMQNPMLVSMHIPHIHVHISHNMCGICIDILYYIKASLRLFERPVYLVCINLKIENYLCVFKNSHSNYG